MLPQRREHIHRLADAVRNGCGLPSPLDVKLLATRLNGRIIEESAAEFEAKIERDGAGFKISLAKGSNERRQRFSIAHELGHLFLHMGYLVNDAKWKSSEPYKDAVYYRFGYSIEESEANEFAAALLMPRDEFRKVSHDNQSGGMVDIDGVAEHFMVSADAALTRGRWLNMFAWS